MNKIFKILIFQSVLSLPLCSFAQSNDNAEIKQLYDESNSIFYNPTDLALLVRNDSIRELKIYTYLKSNLLKTSNDYFYAGSLLLKGRDQNSPSKAVELFRKAIQLDSTLNKWCLANAIDREFMSRNEPQMYGTIIIKNKQDQWVLYKIDSLAVTDVQRKQYNVETLTEKRIKLWNMNLPSVSELYASSITAKEMAAIIKYEMQSKRYKNYNVNEEEINNLGYAFMSANQFEEALIILKLNSELYPNGFNTFDSLGECYFNLKNYSLATAAYRTSLHLNSKNENAVSMIKKMSEMR